MVRPAVSEDSDAILFLEKKYFPYPRINIDYKDFVVDNLLRGYADMKIIIDEGYIGNVLVKEEYRRMGIADEMIDFLIKTGSEKNLEFITLEVRTGNVPAINLYKKHGFEIQGILKNHYSSPKEDAYIMTVRKPF